ncbi:HTH-type transcriptional repressor CarH [soil metagenome]
MDIISTRAVAEVLGVSEATVKRWSDAGTLRCFRTPGGHRKFRLRDVNAFLLDNEDSVRVEARSSTATSALAPDQAEARSLALAGDADALVSLVAKHRMAGTPLARIFDQIFTPAMADIGREWAEGSLTAAQEHLASGAVVDMLARVRPLVERSNRNDRGSAICACLSGEQHAIGLQMVGLVLGSTGYRVGMLGANVPTGDLALMVAANAPALLALSASSPANQDTLRGALAVIESAAAATKTRFVVGGAGFNRLTTVPANVRRESTLETFLNDGNETRALTSA